MVISEELMMRMRFAIISCAFLAWACGPAPVYAFEQQAPAAVPAVPAAPAPAPARPDVSLDAKAAEPAPGEKQSRGVKLPGIGKITIPKLNFGLDLMYGAPEAKDTELGFSPEPGNGEDVTIMGKVKRRF